RKTGHLTLSEADGARGGLDEARDHAQGRRFSAPRGAQEREELTVADGQADVVDRRGGPAVDLGDVLEVDRIHLFLLSCGRAPPGKGGTRRGAHSCSAVVLDAAGP